MLRDTVRLVAPALAVALVAAAIATREATAAEGYWEAGYLRLLAAELVSRWDRYALVAVGAGIVVAAVLTRVRPRIRRGLGLAVAVLALLALARLLVAADAWRAARGPNLLLISIDTLRADRLGAYGCPLPTSPSIDRRLAGEGVTFENVVSQSPKTTPSHLTMLTSLYPAVHGVELWNGKGPPHALAPAVATLAEVLRNAGFTTGAFTGGAYMDGAWGFRQGFQTYEECYGRELGRAQRWLKHNGHRRFFLFFHTFQVHDPYVPPLDVVDRFDGTYQGPLRDAVRRIRQAGPDWENAHRVFWDSARLDDPRDVTFLERLYDAGIRHMDETTITPILDQLDRLGVAKDTLVVFTSDHGEAFGEHGKFMHDDLYFGTLHVPLIVRFPGRLPAGARVGARGRLVDVMPTILDLLGISAPPAVQGQSLLPLVRATPSADGNRAAPSDYGNAALASLRDGRWAYIVDGATELLFDTAADPAEQENLAGSRPDELAAMRAGLARWQDENARAAERLGAAGIRAAPGDEAVRRLRALGYLQ